MTQHVYPHTLKSRADAPIDDARQGMAVILRVTAEDKAEAQKLVGNADVIVATHEEAMAFLQYWMAPLFSEGRRVRQR